MLLNKAVFQELWTYTCIPDNWLVAIWFSQHNNIPS